LEGWKRNFDGRPFCFRGFFVARANQRIRSLALGRASTMAAECQVTKIRIGPRNKKAGKKKIQTLKLWFQRCELQVRASDEKHHTNPPLTPGNAFQVPNTVFWSIGAPEKCEGKAGGGGERRGEAEGSMWPFSSERRACNSKRWIINFNG
jgi:hypothetical protein